MKRGKRHLRDYVIPHHGNNHTPHALGHGALLGYSVSMVLLKFGLLTAGIALPAASLFSSAITPKNIIELTNVSREGYELGTLREHTILDESAQKKAEDMLVHQYFAHTSPTGATPWSWIKGEGYSYQYAGENLAVYYTQAEDVTAGWLASPTHRANILDERFTDIGVGVAEGTYNGFPAIFVVQHFGKPSYGQVTPKAPEPLAVAPTPVTITPAEESYQITVSNPNAEAVTVQLGATSVPLKKSVAGEWAGTVPVDERHIPKEGQELIVISSSNDVQLVEPAAVIAPHSTTQNMYLMGNANKRVSFFGINAGDLNDRVTQIYLGSIIVLSTLLMITLLAKMHWQRLPMAAHVLAVIGLAAVLMAI